MAQTSQLRFNPDQTYELKIIEISCSICDHDELIKSINQSGNWDQRNDTIYLEQDSRFLILNDSTIRPLNVIGLNRETMFDSLNQERLNAFEQRLLNNELFDFHLVYDTYPNGVARIIKDRYRYRMGEYELELDENGLIEELRYYWNDKRKRKLK